MAEDKLPPLTPAGFQVLLALAARPAHGYAVMQFVEEVSGGDLRLGPGTLYRTIARLAADGLVEEVSAGDDEEPHDARRRNYRLTPLGRATAGHEAELMARLVDVAASAGLIGDARRRHTA